jgi:O-antigen ligase
LQKIRIGSKKLNFLAKFENKNLNPRLLNVFNEILFYLIGFSIILLPINGLPYIKILGELSLEAATYPMLLGVLIFGIIFAFQRKLIVPRIISSKILFFFLLWIIVSAIFNSPVIFEHFVKERSGVEKYFIQLILMSFVSIVSVLTFTVFQQTNRINPFSAFRKFVIFSLVVSCVYSFVIDIPAMSGQQWAINILQWITKILHGSNGLYTSRLRSLSGEASWFGMYLGYAFPWLISSFLSERRWIKYPIFLIMFSVLVLTYLTFSRTANLLILFDLVVFLPFIFTSKQSAKRINNIGLIVILFFQILLTFTSLGNTLFSRLESTDLSVDNRQSNIARFGSQVTAINMGLDHPVFGVGLGQYGFHMKDYIPAWAADNSEIKVWSSEDPNSPWPPVHGLWARVLAETGFPGLLLWSMVWITLLINIIKRYLLMRNVNPENALFGLTLLVTILCLLLIGFVSDSFRYMFYWIPLGLSWVWLSKTNTS